MKKHPWMEGNQLKVIVLGAGNLSYHLTPRLALHGIRVLQIYSRNIKNAGEIARQVNATPVGSIKDINQGADLYLFMVRDDAIDVLIKTGHFNNKNLVHFAGVVPMNIFNPYSGNQGVIYPLQTFSKNEQIDYDNIPVFLESSNTKMKAMIEMVSSPLFKIIHHNNSKQRAFLHLSAVFACNFSNFMLGIARELAGKDSFDMLKPLMQETLNKGFRSSPFENQTGPAKRNDTNTINKHAEMLKDYPDFKKIYNFMSEKISGYYLKKEGKTDE